MALPALPARRKFRVGMPKPLKAKHLSDDAITLIAARFKVLSEPTRLRLLIALEKGEKSVTELAHATHSTQSSVSRHLQNLADAGLVKRRKEGVTAYYAIADAQVFALCEHVCGSVQRRLQQQGQAASHFDSRLA